MSSAHQTFPLPTCPRRRASSSSSDRSPSLSMPASNMHFRGSRKAPSAGDRRFDHVARPFARDRYGGRDSLPARPGRRDHLRFRAGHRPERRQARSPKSSSDIERPADANAVPSNQSRASSARRWSSRCRCSSRADGDLVAAGRLEHLADEADVEALEEALAPRAIIVGGGRRALLDARACAADAAPAAATRACRRVRARIARRAPCRWRSREAPRKSRSRASIACLPMVGVTFRLPPLSPRSTARSQRSRNGSIACASILRSRDGRERSPGFGVVMPRTMTWRARRLRRPPEDWLSRGRAAGSARCRWLLGLRDSQLRRGRGGSSLEVGLPPQPHGAAPQPPCARSAGRSSVRASARAAYSFTKSSNASIGGNSSSVVHRAGLLPRELRLREGLRVRCEPGVIVEHRRPHVHDVREGSGTREHPRHTMAAEAVLQVLPVKSADDRLTLGDRVSRSEAERSSPIDAGRRGASHSRRR